MSRGKAKANGGALSRATAFRLSQYLRCLPASPATGTVSSSQLAETVGVSDAQVRRDLAAVGHLGQRGVGYDWEALALAIRTTLGIHRPWRAVLVGVGNLARALLRYRGFQEQGFEIVGLFDSDPAKIGTAIESLPVFALDSLPQKLKALKAELGVISVPADAAQSVADKLVSAGIKGLLNFAPTMVKAPPRVPIVSVDLSIQFEQLAFQVGRSGSEK